MKFNTFRNYFFTATRYTNKGTTKAPIWNNVGLVELEVNDAGTGLQVLSKVPFNKGDRLDNIADSNGVVIYALNNNAETANSSTHLVTGLQVFLNPFGQVEYYGYKLAQTA